MPQYFLPEGVEPLKSPEPISQTSDAYQEVKTSLSLGMIPQDLALDLINALPPETLRVLVQKVSGTDASFLLTFTRQVQLAEAVLNSLVYPDGRLRPEAAEIDISLKDAMAMSSRITQMMLKDLPKLYNVDRIQRLEQAMGDVMEQHFTAEQQNAVLVRLQELTGE